LLPQVSANPAAIRFFQHGQGNNCVFDQCSYTVSLSQPVFNAAALEVFKKGDPVTKVSDLQFSSPARFGHSGVASLF
jgi:outer membrane protein